MKEDNKTIKPENSESSDKSQKKTVKPKETTQEPLSSERQLEDKPGAYLLKEQGLDEEERVKEEGK